MQLFLFSSFSRGLSSIFCFVLLLSFIFEKGGCATPVTPPPLIRKCLHSKEISEWTSGEFGSYQEIETMLDLHTIKTEIQKSTNSFLLYKLD